MTADPFLRLSVLGSARNADLVVPADQPAATLMPQVLALLGEPGGLQGTYTLTTALGEAIDLERPVGTLGLEDGSVLQLALEADAPPVPVVSDLVDATAEHETGGRWTPTSRGWVFGVLSALAALAALVLLLRTWGVTATHVGLGAAALYVVSIAWRFVRRDLAWTHLGAAGVTALWWAHLETAAGQPRLLVLLALAAALLLALAVHTRQPFPFLLGLVVLAAEAGVWWATARFVDDPSRAGAVVATLALLLLGLLPRLALSVAGVFKADDAVGRGAQLALSDVAGRLGRAHQVLAVCVGLVAVLWTLGIAPLAAHATTNAWTLAMAGVLLVAWTLRGRHFPLAAERMAIYSASLVAVGSFAWAQRGSSVTWAVVGLLVVASGLAAALFVRVSDLAGAQLRRAATWAETLMVVATIPVLVGLFGLYTQLLASFR